LHKQRGESESGDLGPLGREKRRRRMAVGIRSEVARKKKMNRTGNLPAG
jgi:hypothetical protein